MASRLRSVSRTAARSSEDESSISPPRALVPSEFRGLLQSSSPSSGADPHWWALQIMGIGMHILLRKLTNLHDISEEEQAAVLEALTNPREIKRGDDIVADGS